MTEPDVKMCATCKHWQRPTLSGELGGCNLVWPVLRWWSWLYRSGPHDGCERHEATR